MAKRFIVFPYYVVKKYHSLHYSSKQDYPDKYIFLFEPAYDKSNKMAWAPSGDFPKWHPPILISLRCALSG